MSFITFNQFYQLFVKIFHLKIIKCFEFIEIHCFILILNLFFRQPQPLFKKLEQKEIDELRNRFIGKQNNEKETLGTNQTSDELNQLIAAQGDKVRKLKAQKVAKDIIEAEVKILLNLKQQLNGISGNTAVKNVTKSKQKTK